MKRNLICSLVLTLWASATASSADWPTYLGDNPADRRDSGADWVAASARLGSSHHRPFRAEPGPSRKDGSLRATRWATA